MKLAPLFLLCCGVAMGQTGKVTLVVPTPPPDCCYRIHDQEITLVGSEDWPDVPAVRDGGLSDAEFYRGCRRFDGKTCTIKDRDRLTPWTCADKSRILLTAENGSRWCHKVQAGPEPVANQLGGNALPERDWQVSGDPPDAPSHHPTDDLKWPIDTVGVPGAQPQEVITLPTCRNGCYSAEPVVIGGTTIDDPQPKPKRNWAHEFGRIDQ